jgi:hypothetical protein
MDNHRSGPVCNHSVVARGVLNPCVKDKQQAKALVTSKVVEFVETHLGLSHPGRCNLDQPLRLKDTLRERVSNNVGEASDEQYRDSR